MSMNSRNNSLLRLACLVLFDCLFASHAASSEPQQPRELFAEPGSIVPARLVHVTSLVPGVVTKVRVEVADVVKAGEVLAELDATRAKLEVELAQAKLELARARYQALEAGLAEKERQQSPGRERLVVVAAEIKTAEIDLRLAECGLGATQIVAPSEGTVLAKGVQVGDFVDSQASDHSRKGLLDLADLRRLELVVDVPDRLVSKVFQGQQCRIDLDAIPNVVYQGSVARISPAADPTTRCFRTYVEIQLPEKDNRILPGMYGKVGFLAKE